MSICLMEARSYLRQAGPLRRRTVVSCANQARIRSLTILFSEILTRFTRCAKRCSDEVLLLTCEVELLRFDRGFGTVGASE